jgi:hypothetical protein
MYKCLEFPPSAGGGTLPSCTNPKLPPHEKFLAKALATYTRWTDCRCHSVNDCWGCPAFGLRLCPWKFKFRRSSLVPLVLDSLFGYESGTKTSIAAKQLIEKTLCEHLLLKRWSRYRYSLCPSHTTSRTLEPKLNTRFIRFSFRAACDREAGHETRLSADWWCHRYYRLRSLWWCSRFAGPHLMLFTCISIFFTIFTTGSVSSSCLSEKQNIKLVWPYTENVSLC